MLDPLPWERLSEYLANQNWLSSGCELGTVWSPLTGQGTQVIAIPILSPARPALLDCSMFEATLEQIAWAEGTTGAKIAEQIDYKPITLSDKPFLDLQP
ncbi:MAG: hypothetical protein AAGA46_00595 [Cyanobacteria bacterium P01_F01_bin.13]